MTNHNNAAQSAMQETVLTDLEIQETLGAIFVASHPYGRRDVLSQWEWEKAAARAIESALLSKLRAPVADERQGDIAAALQDSAYCAGLQRGFELGNHNDNDGLRRALESRDGYVKTIKDARAALASAPVAGEAVAWRVTHPRCPKPRWRDTAREPAPSLDEVKQQDAYLDLELAYAAPQASEAVRDALMAFDEAMRLCDDFPELQHHRDALLFAVQKARAALSAQPGAQKEQNDA